MNKLRKLWCLTALAATSTFFLAGFHDVFVLANSTPQTIPFSQDWTNTGLITANDDWTSVPGIEGFLGQDITTATGVDPRTILTGQSGVLNDLDVIANQTNPDTLATGGVAEFDGIANPSIALNGSGTADVPHIILTLNTTGQSNVRVAYNARDLDASTDNAIQQINTQYRVGNTGNFINLPGGHIADATTQGTATQVTPVAVTLPVAANNKPIVQVRIMSTNAVGNDEWVGIDDIAVTTVATAVRGIAPVDFDGDLRTDYAVVRNLSPQQRWFYSLNGSGTVSAVDWGNQGDTLIPEDFDGDGKDDIAVWRGGTGTSSAFIILQSSTGSVRIENFGVIGDDATVAGDYDGDGKSDLAVYRPGASAGQQSTWFYKGSLNNAGGNITFFPWGANGDRVAPGDYDGDGKNDFVVTRDAGAGQAIWWQRLSNGGTITRQYFGMVNDHPVPGDYDGDGKTDLAVQRADFGPTTWFVLRSSDAAMQQVTWGTTSDTAAQGDYDGDGKTDIAIWRPADGNFWVRNSSGGVQTFQLGTATDQAIAVYNRH